MIVQISKLAQWLKLRSTLCAQVALIERDRILLVRTSLGRGWELPGAIVAPPEPPENTAMRALGLQTGYTLLDSPELLGVFPDPERTTPCLYFTVFISSNFTAPVVPLASSYGELRWFSRDVLPQDASPICGKVTSVLVD